MAVYRKILVIYCRCLEHRWYRKQVENSLISEFSTCFLEHSCSRHLQYITNILRKAAIRVCEVLCVKCNLVVYLKTCYFPLYFSWNWSSDLNILNVLFPRFVLLYKKTNREIVSYSRSCG